MTIKTNSAEGGTDGVTATLANTGGLSGSIFDVVTAGVTFSAAAATDGSLGYSATSSTQYVQWNVSDTVILLRTKFRTSDISQGATLLRAPLSSGSVSISAMTGVNAGKAQLFMGSGRATSPTILSNATTYRAEMLVDSPGGKLRAAIYADNSSTPIWDSGDVTGLTVNTPTAAMYGKYDSGTATVHHDTIGLKTGADAVWGAWPLSNIPPSVDAGANQAVAASATVNLSGTASDADGTVSSVAWTWLVHPTNAPGTNTGITNPATLTPSFAASATLGTFYTLRLTATDNLGATSFDDVEIAVPVAGATDQRMVPTSGSGVGTWTIAGGSTSEGAALSDESDATYLESPSVSGVEVSRRLRVTPGNAKSTGQLVEKLWTDTGTATVVLRLYEGSTLRQQWTAFTLTSTPTSYTLTLLSGTISAITDWKNLYIEVGATT
jgi:hypothetical protein